MIRAYPLRNEKWSIFISGRGSNLQALIDQGLTKKIAVVVSDQQNSEGLLKARRFGLTTLILDRPIDWSFVHESLVRRQVTKIFLLGFMRILPQSFLQPWEGRIFNIHPSLLPLYPGKDSFTKSFNDQADIGATLHHVTFEVDAGDKIFQKKSLAADLIQTQQIPIERAQISLSFTEHRLVREGFQCL